MFGTKIARQYPNLVGFILESGKEDWPTPLVITGSVVASFGVISMIGAFISGAGLIALLGLAPIFGGIGVALSSWYRKPRTSEEARKRDVRAAAKIFKALVDNHRLHRDLDPNSLLVLEECAHHWMRVKIAFTTGQWQESSLPHTYVTARDAALRSATEAMEDVLLAYREVLPKSVDGRSPMDYIDEALEAFTIKGKSGLRPIPPSFAIARDVADRLRTLADEAERLAFQSRQSEGFRPGRSLDSALSGLRDLRAAEEELEEELQNRLN
jgi:hypothetical protein